MPRRNLYTLIKSASPIAKLLPPPRCSSRPESPCTCALPAYRRLKRPRHGSRSGGLGVTSQIASLRGGLPGRRQVRDQARVGSVLGFGARSSQHGGRVNGTHHEAPPGAERGLLCLALVLSDPVPRAEHGLPCYRAQQHHQPRPDRAELGLQPEPAGPDLGAVRALVDPTLTPLGPLEVLDRVGHVHVGTVDAGLVQSPVQDPARGPDERMALFVLLVTRLLTDQRDGNARPAFAEHRLRRPPVQIAPRALGRLVPEFLPASHGRPPTRPAGQYANGGCPPCELRCKNG